MRKGIKDLLQEGILLMPGVFNGILARLVEDLGYRAIYISGAGLANGVAAIPDIGLLTMTEVVTQSRYIIDAVDIPCIVDGDTGFGEAVNLMRTIKELEHIGAAGIHIEDQVMPKKCGHLSGKHLVSTQEMIDKIKAAVDARNDPDFFVIARTDARGVEGLEGTIERAKHYIDAGADAIFPDALESKEEFLRFAKEMDAPLLANMTEFGKTPYINIKEFEEMGYSMVIFPLTALRIMLRAVKDALEMLKMEGTQKNFLDRMFTRKEVYNLIKYND